MGLPCRLSSKESTCNAGEVSLIPRPRRSPGEGNVSPPQYSCLGNPMDREACRATAYGITKVRLDLATELPTPHETLCNILFFYIFYRIYLIEW